MFFVKFTILNVNFSSKPSEYTGLLGRIFLLFVGYKNNQTSTLFKHEFRFLKHNHIKKVNWILSKIKINVIVTDFLNQSLCTLMVVDYDLIIMFINGFLENPITSLHLQSSEKRTSCQTYYFYKENVPVNPHKAGHANIYPESRKSQSSLHGEDSIDFC